eukprot:7637795-Alexandrium_andersonii.AAC.1
MGWASLGSAGMAGDACPWIAHAHATCPTAALWERARTQTQTQHSGLSLLVTQKCRPRALAEPRHLPAASWRSLVAPCSALLALVFLGVARPA